MVSWTFGEIADINQAAVSCFSKFIYKKAVKCKPSLEDSKELEQKKKRGIYRTSDRKIKGQNKENKDRGRRDILSFLLLHSSCLSCLISIKTQL